MPVPCLLLFLVSEKLHRKYSRNWTKQKPEVLFFPEGSRAPKKCCSRTRGLHTPLGAARGLAAPRAGVGHPLASRLRPFAYILPRDRKREVPDQKPQKSSAAAVVVNPRSGGFCSSPRHPAGGGDHRRRALHHHARLRHDPWVVHHGTTGPWQ